MIPLEFNKPIELSKEFQESFDEISDIATLVAQWFAAQGIEPAGPEVCTMTQMIIMHKLQREAAKRVAEQNELSRKAVADMEKHSHVGHQPPPQSYDYANQAFSGGVAGSRPGIK
jgi:hypothetical protein